MPEKIRIRYKDSHPSWPGDVASFNGHNQPGGFHGPKYPGYEEDIPGDFLDDVVKEIDYRNPDKSIESITKMEYRRRIYETGGYHRQPGQKFHQPAPPHIPQNKTMLKMYVPPRKLEPSEMEEFLWKTKVATLLFAEFSPLCMEFVGPIPEDALALLKKKAKETGSPTYINLLKGPGKEQVKTPDPINPEKKGSMPTDAIDISKMDEINAVKYVKELTDINMLSDYSAKEAKRSRPRVAFAIEERIADLKHSAVVAAGQAANV